ncbi:MAG: sigma-54 dependent transcriptional regulator [Desulfobacteraceae bacterium]|jgi:two-component system NtrC family response regulator
MGNVLIIDDDVGVCMTLKAIIESKDHCATFAHTLAQGLEHLRETSYDLLMLDVHMPDGNGLDLLPAIRNRKSPPEVIIITGNGDADGAELAIKTGAWDYLQKPLSPSKVLLPLTHVFNYRKVSDKASEPSRTLKLGGIIGRSRPMQISLDALANAASHEANVLITGETGTGKELFARACHENSIRSGQRFITVDCASMPGTLVENILFGHRKGAFTGANTTQTGMVELADGGTLFLDEVGELPLSMQKAFLRVLQERCFRPIGAKMEVKSDFRLISATNRNLEEMVEQGRFREDLLYRLRSYAIELSPLRERPEDIRDLVLHYLSRLCKRSSLEMKGFTPDFLEAILSYPWPGNVRELINTLEAAMTQAGDDPTLIPNHLPIHVRAQLARASVDQGMEVGTEPHVPLVQPPEALPAYHVFRESALDRLEKEYLQRLIRTARGSIKEACQLSGLGRTRLYTLMKKHELSRLDWGTVPSTPQ